jgi:hypothetical protein
VPDDHPRKRRTSSSSRRGETGLLR